MTLFVAILKITNYPYYGKTALIIKVFESILYRPSSTVWCCLAAHHLPVCISAEHEKVLQFFIEQEIFFYTRLQQKTGLYNISNDEDYYLLYFLLFFLICQD